MTKPTYLERDTSWLYFNHRVLQEAQDERNPLYERIKFLAIYSSNLDEFFRVRVASLRSFKELRKKDRREWLDVKPKQELRIIQRLVQEQQEQFGHVFRNRILPSLAEAGVHLINNTEYSEEQQAWIRRYFEENVRPHIVVERREDEDKPLFLADKQLYLVTTRKDDPDGELIFANIPTKAVDRFVQLPAAGDQHYITFLDDIVRSRLPTLLGHAIGLAYAVKTSRDAELYIENEYDGDLVEKIRESLAERQDGLPTRFLYDSSMPKPLRQRLKNWFHLSKYDMVPGARYHNFHDFFSFPDPLNRSDWHYPSWPPQPHPVLEQASSLLDLIESKDQLLHFPYQRYDYVPRLIREAADRPTVTTIQITLYRVAGDSEVVRALLYARERGKTVNVFVEAKARFDEESNLYWGVEMERAGAQVRYSYPGIKVHTKLLIITEEREGKDFHFAYIGTGNFNEKTARIYTDHALLTADQRLTREVNQVFLLLNGQLIVPKCKRLLVAPFQLRDRLLEMIDREIDNAKAGKTAYLHLKLNALEEKGMIDKLREAAAAGVEVRLIVRGIFCMVLPDDETNGHLDAVSFLDRYLEHGRVLIFGNDGDPEVYIGSADWMNRNLFRRVEVMTPIYDPDLRQQLIDIFHLQWRDHTKTRWLTGEGENAYRRAEEVSALSTTPSHLPEQLSHRAQEDVYHYVAGLADA